MSTSANLDHHLPTHAASFADKAGAYLRSAGERILDALVAMSESSAAASKARAFQALSALSDEELAKRGLTRDGLASHVFGPLYS